MISRLAGEGFDFATNQPAIGSFRK